MRSITLAIVAAAIAGTYAIIFPLASRSPLKTTAQRIAAHNYPVETHTVQTPDGYVLTMFRIPYSPKLNNQNKRRPVAFLQHGLLSSSDCWILNGPNDALAFLLVDAGYDVWLGNARGNTYSRNHVEKSPLLPSFWDFSWNEIALNDIPAMIDYILLNTKEKALHYVGHSQGTTVFFVLMSSIPKYNSKIKTAHMLAPVAYMSNMRTPLASVAGPILGFPSVLKELIGNAEFMPSTKLMAMMGSAACAESSLFQPICTNSLFLMCGWDSKHLNYTLLSDAAETHPAGSSTGQVIHYVQEYLSGEFRKYDHGMIMNKLKYNQWTPPKYVVENIVAPVRLYYSDNDYLSSVADVHKLEKLLPNLVEGFHVPYPDWNHLDYIFGMEVKDLLYDRIINATNRFEKTGKQ